MINPMCFPHNQLALLRALKGKDENENEDERDEENEERTGDEWDEAEDDEWE